MKQSARIQTTIEIWDALHKTHLPMDKFCGDYFRARRYIGSKDRRDIAARLYNIMRAKARISWWADHLNLDPDNARIFILLALRLSGEYGIAQIQDLFCGENYAPSLLSDQENSWLTQIPNELEHSDMPQSVRFECPKWAYEWLVELWGDHFDDEMTAMMQPALLHLRVNQRKANLDQVIEALAEEKITAEKGLIAPHALRLTDNVHLSQTKAFKKGWVDIQDEGSQAIAELCRVQPGMQVLDYCAGGGGKTLALADQMDGKGRIVAMDNNTKRLERGKKRYVRADIHNVEMRSLEEDRHRKWLRRQKEKFDVVLIDAPCSGSGTWRRNPDMRWRDLTAEEPVKGTPSIAETLRVQSEILNRAAPLTKIGGALIYATCSLFKSENEDQIARFLNDHLNYEQEESAMRLSPARDGTDGFFAVRLIRKS